MNEKTQKSFRDACLWVSWTLLTSVIEFFSSIFSFDLFCFLLHYILSLALTDQVTSALLPMHHALIMVCLWSPVTTLQRVRGAHRLHTLIHIQMQEASLTLFFAKGQFKGWSAYGSAGGVLRRNATSRTSISLSLLILESRSHPQTVTKVSSPSHEDRYWTNAF